MLAGLLVGAWLVAGPKVLGHVTFDVHTLVYAATAVLLGFQAVTFAVFTKIFAISAGLLPQDLRLDKLFKVVTLEVGLLIGGVFILIGLVGSMCALGVWGAKNFGPLDPTRTLRMVVPAVVALALGCQTVFSSFFLSVLGMQRQ